MKVFIALCDVESSTGGGQTIYRQMFRRYPQIEFTYLLDAESANHPRPANVQGLRLGPWYVRKVEQTSFLMTCYCWAKTIAATLRGHEFDIVEVPDFMTEFSLLPAALCANGTESKISVSLHGRSTTTLEWEWPPVGRIDHERIDAENLLFGSSDVRYGISPFYLDEWKSISSLPTQFVNPLAWLSFPPLQQAAHSSRPPDLLFIGRTERRKGPDLFVEMLGKLPRELYSSSSILGPSVPITETADSNDRLREMIQTRHLDTTIGGKKTGAELLTVFGSRSVIVLPSRYDTLNLVAIESLLAGCPAVIGSGAGACRFLDEQLPSIPYTRFNINDLDAATTAVTRLLKDYDAVRDQIAVAVQSLKPVPLPDLESIYRQTQSDPLVRGQAVNLFQAFEQAERLERPSLARRVKRWVAKSPQLSRLLLSLQNRLNSKKRSP